VNLGGLATAGYLCTTTGTEGSASYTRSGMAKPADDFHDRVGLNETTSVPVVVHKYPAVAKTTEVHLTHSSEAVALPPMTSRKRSRNATSATAMCLFFAISR